MTRRARFWRLLAALLLFPVCAAEAAAGQVALSPEELERAGIAVAALHTVRMPQSIPALGSVLDPAPLIVLSGQIATIEAQIAGADAKVSLDKQLMAQASALYKHGEVISLTSYQKASQELAASQATLAWTRAKRQALLAQTEAQWGPTIAAIVRSDGEPLPQVAAGKSMLVGLSLPPGKTVETPPRQLEAEAAGIHFPIHLLAAVPRMLGGYPGQAFVYEAATQPGVPIGTTVAASFPAGPIRTGVVVPFSGVLWKGGHALVFRAAAKGRFEAVPIATGVPTARGYFVSERLSGGNRIVVRGAALLLGGSSPPAGGEDGDDD